MLANITFNIVTHPTIDKFLFCQGECLRRIFKIIGFQVDLLQWLAPTGMPKNIKGIDPILQARKDDTSWRKSCFTLTPKILLLFRFTHNPEAISNLLIIASKIHKLDHFTSHTSTVSSTNYNSTNWTLSLTLNRLNSKTRNSGF